MWTTTLKFKRYKLFLVNLSKVREYVALQFLTKNLNVNFIFVNPKKWCSWNPIWNIWTFKGTVQQDFRPPVFFIIRTGMGYWPMGQNSFVFGFAFVKIFEFKYRKNWLCTVLYCAESEKYLILELNCENEKCSPLRVEYESIFIFVTLSL